MRHFHNGRPPEDAAAVYETLRQITAETPPMSATSGWFRIHYIARRASMCEATAYSRLLELANGGLVEVKVESAKTTAYNLWRLK